MSINRENIITLYKSGVTIKQIRNITKGNFYKIRQILIDENLFTKDKIKNFPIDEIINEYTLGNSILSISKKHNIPRITINRRLKREGINIRNGSDANIIRFNNATDDYKKDMVKKANEKIRNMPKEFHHSSSIKQAITKSKTLSKVGQFEIDIFDKLVSEKFNPIQQTPVDAYNIDITVRNIAIEIHVSSVNPTNHPKYTKRIKYLIESGWFVVYIKINKSGLTKIGIDKLVSIVNEFSFNPSNRCKYWMISGTGETLSFFGYNGVDFTNI